MTDLHLALSAAGVPLPTQMQRIWLWLKDHQPQSAKHVAAALHIPQANTLLSQMERRRMVTCTKELDRSSGFVTRRYSTVGRTYELLPMPHPAAPAAPVQAPQIVPPLPMDGPMAAPFLHYKPGPIVRAPAPQFDLDTLTIAEARALYTRLARMFKGESA